MALPLVLRVCQIRPDESSAEWRQGAGRRHRTAGRGLPAACQPAYRCLMADDVPQPRWATVADAAEIARLLVDFNAEFDTPTPPVEVITERLRNLLATPTTAALLSGEPAVAVGLVTYRTNVWYDGPVALLDELYVVPHLRGRGIGSALIEKLVADSVRDGVGMIEINVDEGDVDTQRFYDRHGFTTTEPGSTERAFYYWLELRRPVP
jgi:GNAT superfamily N-acetyltransferase